MPNVAGRITPDGDAGIFALAFAEHLRGGLHVVFDLTARDAIPADRRLEGMEVKVLVEGAKYTLTGGITNADWVEVETGNFPEGATENAVLSFDGINRVWTNNPTFAGVTLNGKFTEFAIIDPDSSVCWRTLTDKGSAFAASPTDWTPSYKSWRVTRNMNYTHDATGNTLVRTHDTVVHSWTQFQFEAEWRDPGSGWIQNELNLTEDGKRSIAIFTRIGVKILSISAANPAVVTTEAAHDLTSGDGVYIVLPAGETDTVPTTANLGYTITVTSPTTFTIPVNVTTGRTWTGSNGAWARAPLKHSLRGGIGFNHPTIIDTRGDTGLGEDAPSLWILGNVNINGDSVKLRISNESNSAFSSTKVMFRGLGNTPGGLGGITGYSHWWEILTGVDSGLASVATDNFLIFNRNDNRIYFYGDPNGRVGIFNTAPTQPLDVTGNIKSSTAFYVGANKVIGAQGAAVADATDAGSVITQFNALLARARAHGLIAT